MNENKEKAKELLKTVGEEIEGDPKNFESLLILVKIGGRNLKYTSGTKNVIEDVGQLEVIKHDMINSMIGSKE